MDSIKQFFNDPLVQPLWGFLILSLCVFLLTVYRAWGLGTFDISKLPKLLRTTVLDKFVPMAILGIAYFTVTDATTKDALIVAYGGAIVLAAAAEVRDLIDAVQNKPELTIGDADPYAPPNVKP